MMDRTGGPLLDLLGRRAESGQPLRVGLIGAGKFGTMFLSQARRLTGLHVLGVADLSAERARLALSRAGWPEAQYCAAGPTEARDDLTTSVTEDPEALLRADGPGAPESDWRDLLPDSDAGAGNSPTPPRTPSRSRPCRRGRVRLPQCVPASD